MLAAHLFGQHREDSIVQKPRDKAVIVETEQDITHIHAFDVHLLTEVKCVFQGTENVLRAQKVVGTGKVMVGLPFAKHHCRDDVIALVTNLV